MVNAQQWLDNNYPKEQRNTIKKLNIAGKDLEGELDLRDFVDLEEFNCENNKLSGCLNLSNLSKLKILTCRNNKIEELKIDNCRNITHLEASGNRQLDKVDLSHLTSELVTFISFAYDNLPPQDLSVFSRFINLETLSLGAGNNFFGSLELLKDLNKLKALHIEGSNIDSGLEYLPTSVKVHANSVSFPNPNNPNPQVVKIQKQLDSKLTQQETQNKGNRSYAIRLKKGAKIIESLERFAVNKEIGFAKFEMIGSVENIEVVFSLGGTEGYKQVKMPESTGLGKSSLGQMELLSSWGNITWDYNNPFTPNVHCHVSLADYEKLQSFGGHLKEATVAITAEIILDVLSEKKVFKKLDNQTNVPLWDFEEIKDRQVIDDDQMLVALIQVPPKGSN